MFKIATWNVNSLKVRLPRVLEWIDKNKPAVLALQETKTQDKDFPLSAILETGYQVSYAGQKTFNGVAILSRHSIEEVSVGLPGFADEQQRVLAATVDGVRIIDFYVPNGQSPDSDKYQYKLKWLEHAVAYVRQQLALYPKLVVLGDFNIAPEDRDVHDPIKWEGSVLVSGPERAAFQGLLGLGLKDAFRLFDQPPAVFSWWDYRAGAFHRNFGLRIDHILISEALVSSCRSCTIDRDTRKGTQPSDHAVVIAGFNDLIA
ncbi:MAG: exodeoxyribonuclease III [Proteobacteria bacterium]|nr:exodeoxyribonuclease III [Pseudomonadota bacterium]